jgi:dienelactone hydrolase
MTRRDLLRLTAIGTVSGGFGLPLATGTSGFRPPLATPDAMIDAYLAAEVKRIGPRFMDGARTKDAWAAARPRLKREFLDMLGLDPLPEKTPLKATVTGTLERHGVTIEKVHFQSKPGLYVTGNLYRPAGRERKPGESPAKHPAILYVCGHSGRGRDGNKTAFQDHGLWFAANGYVCLVVDTLQLGEVAGKHHGTYNLQRWWWHDRGYTPAGVECWNGIRGIDYLCSRPEVDPEKIGVTGISGGGATTCWVAAADDRVKVAVPVSGMSDLECYVIDKIVNGHCDCMFPVNTYQWELTTVLALFAPKPLLFANSDADPIFPMSGNRRIATRLRQCYELLGAKDHFDEYVSKGGHDYRPDLRLAIFGFFHKHLLGSDAAIKDADFPKIEGTDLRVFPTDADLPKDAINATADESFVPVGEVKLPAEAKDFAGWKAGLVKQLREKCFRALPEKVPAAKLAWVQEPGKVVTVSSEENVAVSGITLAVSAPGKGTTLLVLNPTEDPVAATKPLWGIIGDDALVVGIRVRGTGPRAWTRKNPPNTVERSLVLVGQTADGGRVRDLAAVLAGQTEKVRLAGNEQAGVIAAYAALFAPGTVSELVLHDPPTSHRDGPHFLNVLRVLDIPEALGLLAPDVKLTLVGKNAKDKAFDRTAAIYKAAGATDKFRRE